MLKKLHFLLFLLGITSSSLIAQIPAGYYNAATGTGFTLKTQLYNIIKGHTDNGYSGLWTTYQTSDRDYFYENDATILDMYSENPSGNDPYNFTYNTDKCGTYSVEGDCYNREHIIPQSIFNEQSPMVADAHFITPTDGKVNGMRSNYPHGVVGSATYTSQNGSKLGAASNSGYAAGYTGTVFEPINEFKGDIARMYFYFATRYENVITTWGNSYAMFNGTSDQVFAQPFLTILLTWHAQDPVSASEIARNNAIYARQNNRNPFIDHPEYVNRIWGTSSDTQAPTAPTNLAATNITQTTITLGWTASTDNVGVTGYDVYRNGTLLTSVATNNYNVTGLTAATAYSFYVKAKDAVGNISAASSTISVTTSSSTASYCTSKGNSCADEWISKVVVGTFTNTSTATGYTDFTSKTITLTAGSTINISLTPGFSSSAYNEYWKIWIDYNDDKDFEDANELVFNAGAVSNTTKIGTINVISTASGTTRMRVSMKYNASQTACETFSYGEVEDYTVSFGTTAPDSQAPTVPTNLTVSNITQTSATLSWTASTDNVGVTGYNVYRNGTLLGTTTATSYNISGLTASTTYTLAVAAFDAKSNISAQATVNFTTLAAASTKKETFANFSAGGSYLTGTFIGQDGSTWSYNGARGDIAITGSAPTLGKGRTPLSYVISGTIHDGIGTLKFDYMQAFSTAVNLKVYVNNVLVKTITGGTLNIPASSGTITVNVAGDFTLRFEQTNSSSGQIAIDNIEWTSYAAPGLKSKSSGMGYTEDININEVKVFPNPATDQISILSSSSNTSQYTLIDVFGRTIEHGILNHKVQIDISTLTKGMYFVKIVDDNGETYVKKFLKR